MHRSAASRSIFPLLAMLALSAGGCSSEESGEYQRFSDLPKEQPTAIASLDATPLVAPLPELAATTATVSTPLVGDETPLVAIKPIEATSALQLKDNLDNRSAEGTGPREIQLLIPEKSFSADSSGLIRLTYDDFDLLKILNMEPVPANAAEYFPSWLESLDGKKVRVRGFMYPPGLDDGITAFLLARDNQICCMGKAAKIYDLVQVFLKDDHETKYILNRPFDVIGTFRIVPEGNKSGLFQLYEIEDAVVVDR